MKLKILIPLLVASITFLLIGFFISSSIKIDLEYYSDLYQNSPEKCKITSRFSFDQNNCQASASKSFVKNKTSVIIDVSEYLCTNGNMHSCQVRDWFNYFFSSLSYTPPKRSLDTLVSNCFDLNKFYYEREYYCEELSKIASSLNDISTQISINTMKAGIDLSGIHLDPVDYFSLDYAHANIYYEVKCKATKSLECNNIKPWYELKNILRESLININKYKRLKKIVTEICSFNNDHCEMIIEKSDFLALAYTYNDIDFFKNLPLSFEAAIFVLGSIQEKDKSRVLNSNWISGIKSRYVKFLLLNFNNKNKEILEACNSSSDKTGCFLSYKYNKEGRVNINKFKEFCSSGDGQSCTILKIYNMGLDKYVNDSTTIFPGILGNMESLIASDIANSFKFKITSFLSLKRNTIIVFLIFVVFIFQIYIIHLYSKSKDVFSYIRKKTLEEIKSKLKL